MAQPTQVVTLRDDPFFANKEVPKDKIDYTIDLGKRTFKFFWNDHRKATIITAVAIVGLVGGLTALGVIQWGWLGSLVTNWQATLQYIITLPARPLTWINPNWVIPTPTIAVGFASLQGMAAAVALGVCIPVLLQWGITGESPLAS